ncbi:hypothetical protein DXO89_01140 [Xanthomonas oryzae pv. oryzae]|uniref:Uncharacterized protein n=1 Tax=Xanthomonas oryzae pv. oryzae TaxID=64187 RepID=A0A854CNI0_XANOO|nr:hypothetical protein BXO33_06175 [Xanthomonas oryzae pv. oryzae]OLG56741.1 hypothetical protein BXO34_01955 [Xanthomonas oryzae pv. oryzae]OLG61283.1 hypothetical protein BXO407_07225 [Xanthomonas oryzae pv. oryzae]OLG71138.1 hypothetical protein BXO554_10110 [Xanthomonas oryzae pv. oryzae]OLG79235.1 hypothetical protein BXO454_01270 [Xanthomonas oryzae pv. oryzae]
MVLAAGNHIALLQQQFELHLRRQVAAEADAKIRFTGGHCRTDVTGTAIEQTDADFRKQLMQPVDRLRHEVVRRRWHTRHGHRAHPSGTCIADAHQCHVQIIEHALDLRHEGLADGGERDLARGALEQLDVQRRLELVDPAAERRLRDANTFCSAAKAAVFGNRTECL